MISMALGQVREYAKLIETRPDIALFLEAAKDLPADVAVQLTEESISLLTDSGGSLLAFH